MIWRIINYNHVFMCMCVVAIELLQTEGLHYLYGEKHLTDLSFIMSSTAVD